MPLRGSTKGDLGFGMYWDTCHEVGLDWADMLTTCRLYTSYIKFIRPGDIKT